MTPEEAAAALPPLTDEQVARVSALLAMTLSTPEAVRSWSSTAAA